MELSFDEFRSLKKRNKKEKPTDKNGMKEDDGDSLNKNSNSKNKRPSRSFRATLEEPEIQLIYYFLYFIFAIETLLLLVLFHFKVIFHPGHFLDLIILTTIGYFSLYLPDWSIPVQVLGIFRLWRIIKVVNGYFKREEEAHSQTRKEMRLLEEDLGEVEIEISRLKDEVKAGKETQSHLEEAILSYKKQVNTLTEALEIAAMDVAEAAMEEGLDEEGGEEMDLLFASEPHSHSHKVVILPDGSFSLVSTHHDHEEEEEEGRGSEEEHEVKKEEEEDNLILEEERDEFDL